MRLLSLSDAVITKVKSNTEETSSQINKTKTNNQQTNKQATTSN